MIKPKLLDLFCGAGGCSMGYYLAGFEVVGVDIMLQPHYPFEFVQADALTFPLQGFDVVHASPPCQSYSSCQHFPWANTEPAPKLIDPIRACLEVSGKPWVIENVAGANLPDALELCGSMFDLPIRRHRWFSCSQLLFAPGPCCHADGFYNCVGGKIRGYGSLASQTTYRDKKGQMHKREGYYRLEIGREAMGVDWMNMRELSQAVPPSYTKWIGIQILQNLTSLSN